MAPIFLRSGSRDQDSETESQPRMSIPSNEAEDIVTIDLEYIRMPAMTRVAECRRVDTGVGPSMASSSHVNDSKDTDLMAREHRMMSCQ